MIKQDGRYILTINDFNKICRYFGLNTTTIKTREFPQLTFIETRFYDIYTNKCLFSFYDHDGMIRIQNSGYTILYEISIDDIFSKSTSKPPQHIVEAIYKNVHNHTVIAAKKTFDKITSKVNPNKK